MTVEILGTGVAIRPATEEEILVYRRARANPGFEPEISLIYGPVPSGNERYVVAQAFVEFRGDDGAIERWDAGARHGWTLPVDRDPTTEVLALVREAEDDLTDLLADMGIADMTVSRLAFMCAPRRIDLDPALVP